MELIDEARQASWLPTPGTAKLIRESTKVTQKRMAKELGVDRTTLARWEAGISQPRAAHRVQYAALLEALQRVLAT